jgi:hypothetical protein
MKRAAKTKRSWFFFGNEKQTARELFSPARHTQLEQKIKIEIWDFYPCTASLALAELRI